MNRRALSVVVAALAGTVGSASSASAQLRVVDWNISFYDGTDRQSDIQNVLYGVIPPGLAWAGRSMSPDVVVGEEFSSQSAVNAFLTLLNTAAGTPGDWAAATFIDGPDSDSAFFYRTSKVTYLGTTTVSTGGASPQPPRNTYRYDARLKGYTTSAAGVSFYATHMKAQSSGTDDDARRLLEAQRIRTDAQGRFAVQPNFVMLGDTNIQSSSSNEYQALVGSQANNDGQFFDPIKTPGSWNNNGAFVFVHTQDPSSASGGMDDRHDQILVSGSLVNGSGFDYLGNSALTYSTSTWNDPNHSYRAWGNDGTSFNALLKTTGNTFTGASIAQSVINCGLTSGHIPVYCDFRVPPRAGVVQTTIDFGTVNVGSAAPSRTLNVGNGANTALWTANGINPLSYTLAASAGFTAPGGGFTSNAGAANNAHSLTMSTATAGPKSGTVTIASNDPETPSVVVTLTGVVSNPNTPPTANAGPDQVVNDPDGSGFEIVTLNGSGSTDAEGPISNYQWKEGAATLASVATPTTNVNLAVGTHVITLTVTDAGGLTGNDSVQIIVNGRPVANAGPDQTVVDADNSGSEPVTFNGAASSDADGSIASYAWTEGATSLATGVSPTVSMPVGVHTVTLTVTDNRGSTASDIVVVTIDPACPCPADFDASGGTPDAGDVDAFFTAWLNGDPAADADCSGGTPDAGDVDVFFAAWLAGGC